MAFVLTKTQLWFSCFFLVSICVRYFQTSFARLQLEHVNEVFCHQFNYISTFTIWQTTSTQNTGGTAEEEDAQPSCRDDHEVKKQHVRIPCTNYIERMQRAKNETFIGVQRDRNIANVTCKETGREHIYHAEHQVTTENEFERRGQWISQSVTPMKQLLALQNRSKCFL